MSEKIDRDLREKLGAVLAAGVSDEAMKSITKQVEHIRCEIEDDIMYRLKDDLAPNLAVYAAEMAQKAVEMILEGNDDQLRRYLSCEKRGDDGAYIGWTGRSDPPGYVNRTIADQHPVIHGKLFEQGAIALRKKIVEAHRDLLANERVLDLEDQVKSLVAQLNKAISDKDAMWERFKGYER